MSKRDLRIAQALIELRAVLAEQREGVNLLIDAHNALDARVRDLQYRLTYCMERIVVKKRFAPGAILTASQPEFREATLAQFWLEDGPSYIASVEASIDALRQAVEKAEAGEDAIRDAVRETRAAQSEQPAS